MSRQQADIRVAPAKGCPALYPPSPGCPHPLSLTASSTLGNVPGMQERSFKPARNIPALLAAVLVPIGYLVLYTPYCMDSTDFGFFYGYSWRILQGEIPYRDFYYINPAVPVYWHAFWMWLTPEQWNVLGGKAGFVAAMLGAAWMGALYLNKVFDMPRLGVPVPLLATAGFVWGVHSFPHMPWHTIDGVFFAAAALFAGASGLPLLAGLLAILAFLCKQSFLFVPLAVAISVFCIRPRKREALLCLAGSILSFAAYWFLLHQAGAWEAYLRMTSTPLDIAEAVEAGILIYIRQPWWLPSVALMPWLFWRFALGKTPPQPLQPVLLYLLLLTLRYIHKALGEQRWIGFGESWPMLLVVLGGLCILLPGFFLQLWNRTNCQPSDQSGQKQPVSLRERLRSSAALGAALLVAWSVAISGGYKVPAFFAVPLVFTLLIIQARLGGKPVLAAWVLLFAGLLMFRAGYEYPYVYPQRPMERAGLVLDAGLIYPKASGVLVDADMYARLEELHALREKYGPRYKTLPSFPLAYYLEGDKPAFPCEWVHDWAINNEVDKLYQFLVDNRIVVFMERDQMDVIYPDPGYTRTRYSVPHKVRTTWRIIEETPHFVVMLP